MQRTCDSFAMAGLLVVWAVVTDNKKLCDVALFVVAAVSDYCQLETFYANCSRGSAVKLPEVAVVRSALYGRMRLSRCVRRDYGHVGCTADVRAEVDAMCSGRLGGCRFPVSRLNPRQPCPGDLTPYLQIAYDCVPGMFSCINPLTPTVAICVQLYSIPCQTGLSHHL